MKKPKVSFVIPMKEQDFRVIKLLESIKKQDYPKDKIEIIITDGGSNPKVIEECKKYPVKIYYNPKGFAEGAGMGKDQGIWKSTGDLIVISESDIELIEKDWVKSMLKPFDKDKEIFASVPRLYIHPKDNLTNRYLSYVGVDPFAIYRALEGVLVLNKKFENKKQEYFILKLDKKEPYCMGSNGFMFKKELIKKVGDYAQDVEFISRLAEKDYTKFAVVNNAHVWHKNVKGFSNFLKKRMKWTRNYSKVYIKEKKRFKWITNKPFFFMYTLKNLLIFPEIPRSIRNTFRYKDRAWLIHPFMLFLSTLINVYFTLTSRDMINQIFH